MVLLTNILNKLKIVWIWEKYKNWEYIHRKKKVDDIIWYNNLWLSDEILWKHLKSPEYKLMCWLNNKPNIDKEYMKNADYINWYDMIDEKTRAYKENDFIISHIDEKNKYSNGYFNCTSLVLVFKDKNTGKNKSLLTHQNPNHFLSDKKGTFKNSLISILKEVLKNREEWTIDIAILWWNTNDFWIQYIESIQFLQEIIKNIFWFNPILIWWPVNNLYYDTNNLNSKDIYINTEKRQIQYFKLYNINTKDNEIIPTDILLSTKEINKTTFWKINDLYKKAMELQESEKYIESLEKYNQLLKILPNNSIILHHIWNIYYCMWKYDKVIEML